VFTLNLVANGDVETPAGRVTPPMRSWKANKQLPSAGKALSLPAGISRFGFAGQWLIDWDLYTVAREPQQAEIGNWAHGWNNAREMLAFRQANGRDFEERQHILRVRGAGPLRTVILPYRKGESRNDARVTRAGDALAITSGGATTLVADGFYAYR